VRPPQLKPLVERRPPQALDDEPDDEVDDWDDDPPNQERDGVEAPVVLRLPPQPEVEPVLAVL